MHLRSIDQLPGVSAIGTGSVVEHPTLQAKGLAEASPLPLILVAGA
jgi:hypothetical protein